MYTPQMLMADGGVTQISSCCLFDGSIRGNDTNNFLLSWRLQLRHLKGTVTPWFTTHLFQALPNLQPLRPHYRLLIIQSTRREFIQH